MKLSISSILRELWYFILTIKEYPREKHIHIQERKERKITPHNILEAHMIKPHGTHEHLMTLYMLTKEYELKRILELGTRNGHSTIALLSAAKEIDGAVTSIDTDHCTQAKETIQKYGLSNYWQFIQGNDLEIKWQTEIDHLFIDTLHTYEHTLNELKKYEPWVKKGGIITIHDIVECPLELIAIEDYLKGRKDLRLYKYFNNCGLGVVFKG